MNYAIEIERADGTWLRTSRRYGDRGRAEAFLAAFAKQGLTVRLAEIES